MALFSLLIAIFAERMKALPQNWQIASLLARYHRLFIGSQADNSSLFMFIAVALPAASTALLLWFAEDVLFGLTTVIIWIATATVCLSHSELRNSFKQFIKAACRGDVQACYHLSSELEGCCTKAISEQDLGTKVGQSIAWINYRHYGAVALYLIIFGPIGAVFYSTLRFYADKTQHQEQQASLITQLCFLMDWIPSRLFAFSYLLSGHFSHGLRAWLPLTTKAMTSARTIITETALAAEVLPERSDAPVCIQSTLALLTLAKRSFILLLTLVSLLTIFGWIN